MHRTAALRAAWRGRQHLAGLLLGLAVSMAGAQKAPPTPPAPAPGAGAPWRAQVLSPQDPARFAWVRVAEALGQGSEAVYLRLALLDDWLLALEGQPPQEGRTIETAIHDGRAVRADLLQRRAQAVWPRVLATQLPLAWDADGPDVALPPELEALGTGLTAEAPGLWVHRSPEGRPRGLYLWLGVRNALGEPLPLPEFALRLGRPGQAPAAPPLQCSLPRYSTRLVLPAQGQQHYLCRTSDGPLEAPPAGVGWRAQVGDWLRQGAVLQTEVPSQDQALSRTARMLAQVENPAVDALLRNAQAPGRPAAATAPARPQARAAPPPAAPAQRPWLQRLLLWGGVVLALGIYGLVAHHASVALASALMWTGLAIPCAWFVHSLWSTSWADSWGGIVVIPATAAAVGAPFVGTFVAYHAYRLVVSEQARRNALIFMLVVFAIVVLNMLEARFF